MKVSLKICCLDLLKGTLLSKITCVIKANFKELNSVNASVTECL